MNIFPHAKAPQTTVRLTAEEYALRDAIPFDPKTQKAVILASICNREQVAGFRDKKTGRFREVMLIRSATDEAHFLTMYGLESVETEY